MPLDTVPVQAPLAGATVHVSVAAETGGWRVAVLIERRSPQPPIDGANVDVAAADDQGAALALRDRPTGPLTEVGGAMHTTANAVFRFTGAAPPHDVQVQWDGRSTRFRVVQR